MFQALGGRALSEGHQWGLLPHRTSPPPHPGRWPTSSNPLRPRLMAFFDRAFAWQPAERFLNADARREAWMQVGAAARP
jgi:hypothetical protein